MLKYKTNLEVKKCKKKINYKRDEKILVKNINEIKNIKMKKNLEPEIKYKKKSLLANTNIKLKNYN